MGLFSEDDDAMKVSIIEKMMAHNSKKQKKLKDKLQNLKIEKKELKDCYKAAQENLQKK